MDIKGILISIYVISLPVYGIFKLLALRSLNKTELEIYRSFKQYDLIALIVIGLIGFIVLIFYGESEWGLVLGVGLVVLSILEATLHIKKLKNMPINESAKKKFILAEPFYILFTIAIVASILFF